MHASWLQQTASAFRFHTTATDCSSDISVKTQKNKCRLSRNIGVKVDARSFLRLYFVRRIPLTESIDSLFLSFVCCLYVIRKFAFLLLTTADSDILNKKNLFGNIRKTIETNEQDQKWRRDWFTNRVLLITVSNTRRADGPLSNFLFSLYEFTIKQ